MFNNDNFNYMYPPPQQAYMLVYLFSRKASEQSVECAFRRLTTPPRATTWPANLCEPQASLKLPVKCKEAASITRMHLYRTHVVSTGRFAEVKARLESEPRANFFLPWVMSG
jgi:hypothetical protein